MAEELDVVAFDTGIFDAGLFKASLLAEENLCPLIVEAARARTFRLLMLNTVLDELVNRARKQGWLPQLEDTLIDYLCACDTVWLDPPTRQELADHKQRFWARLRHGADAEVAVEVWKHSPDYFVHSNKEHWGPHVESLLDGVRVVGPRQFLREMGVEPPPPPPTVPGVRRRR